MLPTSWENLLHNSGLEFKIIFSMGIGKLSSLNPREHPATNSRVLRASTHLNVNVTSRNGRMYPFWPSLLEWPNINYEYSPQERQVNDVSTSVALSKDSGIDEFVNVNTKNVSMWGRIDLIINGVQLEDAYPLMAGRVTNVSKPIDGSPAVVSLEDTFDGEDLGFPFNSEYLDKFEFSDLPDEYEGRAKRIFILNSLPSLLPVTPIDSTGKKYYVCEPDMSPPPNEVFVGTERLSDGSFNFSTGQTEYTRSPYTLLTLRKRPESGGLYGQVFVKGGSGPSSENPLQFFTNLLPNLLMASRAKKFIDDINASTIFDYYVIVSSRGSILELLRKRLFPQSSLIPFFRGGKLDIIKEGGQTGEINAVLGGNLKYRVAISGTQTPESAVFNAIDVRYRRDNQPVSSNGLYSRFAVLIDKNYGGKLGRLLYRSERDYGRKPLIVDAADLNNDVDAQALGEGIAQIVLSTHNKYAYFAPYQHALRWDINQKALLTDSESGLVSVKTRIVEKQFLPTGIQVIFQTTDYE